MLFWNCENKKSNLYFENNLRIIHEKKPKKAKKEKKSKSDTDEDKPKKKRPENAYFYFKRQPEIQEKINDYAEENSVTDKRKAAKGVWDELSQDEKDEWKQKAIDEFNKNNDE